MDVKVSEEWIRFRITEVELKTLLSQKTLCHNHHLLCGRVIHMTVARCPVSKKDEAKLRLDIGDCGLNLVVSRSVLTNLQRAFQVGHGTVAEIGAEPAKDLRYSLELIADQGGSHGGDTQHLAS